MRPDSIEPLEENSLGHWSKQDFLEMTPEAQTAKVKIDKRVTPGDLLQSQKVLGGGGRTFVNYTPSEESIPKVDKGAATTQRENIF